MNIVDSSGWLAYFTDEPNAKHFLTPLKDTPLLVIPVVTIYEVLRSFFGNPVRMKRFKRPLPCKKELL
jgi:uncharacterized protein with PIN domain